MSQPNDSFIVSTVEQLDQLFEAVSEVSLKKELSYLHEHYQRLIEASPFAVLATSGPGGLDASPRGDPPGFVQVQDPHTLLIPERRGNNRADSLRNILADPRVALLFLIPGVGETLRVNGRACITVNPELLQRFAIDGKPPKCVLVVTVEAVYFQCARAIRRANLWQPVAANAKVPSPGTMLESMTNAHINGQQYDQGIAERQQASLY